MIPLSIVERRVDGFLGTDSAGVAFATDGLQSLRVTYQPIFSAGKARALKFSGLRAGVDGPEGKLMQAAAPLALLNFQSGGANAVDLYLDRTTAKGWDPKTLGAYLGDVSPSQIFIEAQFDQVLAIQAHKLFRGALAYERADCWLDERITRHRPRMVRMEGEWIAELSAHRSTRALLTTLIGMLRQRGIRTLFEGLNDERLVGFAIDCGADRLQGDALGGAFAAGESVHDHVIGLSDNVVPVAFGHQRRAART